MGTRKRTGKGGGDKAGKSRRGRKSKRSESEHENNVTSSDPDFSESEMFNINRDFEADEKPVKRKVTPTTYHTESGSRTCGPGLCGTFILALLIASGAVYTHYYIGFDNVLEVINTNVASLFQDEISEHGSESLNVNLDDSDTRNRERRETLEKLNEPVPNVDNNDDLDELLPSETLAQKSTEKDSEESEEPEEKEGDAFEEFEEEDDEPVEERQEEEKAQERDDLVAEEKAADTLNDLDEDVRENEADTGDNLIKEPEQEKQEAKDDDILEETPQEKDRNDVILGEEEQIQKDDIAEAEHDLEQKDDEAPDAEQQDAGEIEEKSEAQDVREDTLEKEREDTKSDDILLGEDVQMETKESPKVEDVTDDLLPDETTLEEKKETAEDFTSDETKEFPQANDEVLQDTKDDTKDLKEDDGYETAPENEAEDAKAKDTEEQKIEPIEIEIHHKDAATQTENKDEDELMVEAVQEPTVNIEVEVHRIEIDEPEVIIPPELEPEVQERAEAPEDDFKEFNEESDEDGIKQDEVIHHDVREETVVKENEMSQEEIEKESGDPKEEKLLEEKEKEPEKEDVPPTDEIPKVQQENGETESKDAATQTEEVQDEKRADDSLTEEQGSQETPAKDDQEQEETRKEDEDLIQNGGTTKQTADRATRGEKEELEEVATKPYYRHADITTPQDYEIRIELDKANDYNEAKRAEEGLKSFEKILQKHPKSPRAQFGKAQALDVMSELKQSNQLLEESIAEYEKVLKIEDCPDALFITAAKRLADRQQFRGWGSKGLKTRRLLLDKFPSDLTLWNEFGVAALTVGRVEDARQAFQGVLDRDPNNGFALVHMGFIVKTTDVNYEKAVPLLKRGIESDAPGVIDGRFFFHLGDAQYRLGNHTAAYETYELGANKSLFRSVYQRSLYNVDHLSPKPWWTPEESGNEDMLKMLSENWEIIRDEGTALLDETGAFKAEDENLRESGDWKQFTIFQQGRKLKKNCDKVPKTCALIDQFKDAAECKRGQVKYSVMHPGIHVWPHCGPTNCRIRAHLGLVVPEGPKIRVEKDTRNWTEGKFIIFDDSFEHEVWWTEGVQTGYRLVLIVDMWHPELTNKEKRTLSPI